MDMDGIQFFFQSLTILIIRDFEKEERIIYI